MIYDFDKKELPELGDFDVCICGAGVAGITLALALSDKLNVLLLEGGSTLYSGDSQELYIGKNKGKNYFNLTATRLRFFGGSSNHWGGYCGTLDDFDFQERSDIKYSGWPISKADLAPYLDASCAILNVTFTRDFHQEGEIDKEILHSEEFKLLEFGFSNPVTRFKDKYLEKIAYKKNIHCVLNANLTDVILNQAYDKAEKVEIKNHSGDSVDYPVNLLILAAGGIENPRLLLNFNKQLSSGIGNQHANVGRFFTEHPHFDVGKIILEDNIVENLRSIGLASGKEGVRFVGPTKEFVQAHSCLNFGLRVKFFEYKLKNADSFKEKIKDAVCSVKWVNEAVNHLQSDEIDCHDGTLRIASEQALNPKSTVSLGNATDKFGMKKAVVTWKLLPIDKHTMRVAALECGKFFAKKGVGRVKVATWLLEDNDYFPDFPEEVAGNHHMCTTRMSDNPECGVVDKNQKVFGLDNMYIAGSSVFSTGGQANPTLTIVQMTLRLADHINSKLL